VLRSGWIPTVLAAVFTAAVLYAYGVSAADIAVYAGYLLVGVTLPGLLLWRALRGRADLLARDVAAGTGVGYAVTIFAYLLLRWLGAPQLAIVVPLLIIVVFLAVPKLRRHWRGSGERAPWWWSWLLAAFPVFLAAYSAITFFRGHGLNWPGNSSPYPDIPFQLALAAELKHHFPAVMPYMIGEPLRYHWFFHAHLAAASWATGIELQTLLFRLAILPMLAVLVVGVAEIARAVVKAWWSGPVAVAITLFAAAPWGRTSTGGLLTNIWLSPTQTFGAAIFVALAILLVLMYREGRASRGDWILVIVLLAGVAGAKATFVPMMAAALGLIGLVQLITRRRVDRVTLVAFLLTLATFAFATLVLFRGSSAGLVVDVLGTYRRPGVNLPLRLARVFMDWLLIAWAGVVLLVLRPKKLIDPPILFCLGMWLASVAAVMLTTQPGGSQFYFMQSARPYIAVAATAGLALLTDRTARTWQRLLAAVAAGLMLLSAASDYMSYARPLHNAMENGFRKYPRAVQQIPAGGIEAAYWLRDNSSPDDLVATNVHCRTLPDGRCDNRSFWVSAYAERRALLEGWAYVPSWHPRAVKTHGKYQVMPFWQPQLLADNDAVFTNPTPEAAEKLHEQYGVRWLYVDRRLDPSPDLDKVADLRFQAGDTAVYELR
jgi:hypothetical protein